MGANKVQAQARPNVGDYDFFSGYGMLSLQDGRVRRRGGRQDGSGVCGL
jgi:hypothetical protein